LTKIKMLSVKEGNSGTHIPTGEKTRPMHQKQKENIVGGYRWIFFGKPPTSGGENSRAGRRWEDVAPLGKKSVPRRGKKIPNADKEESFKSRRSMEGFLIRAGSGNGRVEPSKKGKNRR